MFCDLCVFYYTLKVYKVKPLVLILSILREKSPKFCVAVLFSCDIIDAERLSVQPS